MARKKVIDLNDLSALDAWAIGINEMYRALRRSGLAVDLCLAIIVEPSAYPEWILPRPINPTHEIPSWDDEDED